MNPNKPPALRDVVAWANEALAWGVPCYESRGYTNKEWITLVAALRNEVVRLRRANARPEEQK